MQKPSKNASQNARQKSSRNPAAETARPLTAREQMRASLDSSMRSSGNPQNQPRSYSHGQVQGQPYNQAPSRSYSQQYNQPQVSHTPNLNANDNSEHKTTSKAKPKTKPKRKRPVLRAFLIIFLLLFLSALAVGGYICYYLYNNYNDLKASVQYVDALSTAPDDNTGADVTLIVGNDARSFDAQSDILGARSDTIMLLIHSPSGNDTLTSIPRDTYVRIPEFIDEQGVFGTIGEPIELTYNKINAAYSYGGPKLLVRTVELLTNLKVDHYTEIGFDGVEQLVNSVGGINICYDSPINDVQYTGLIWTPGCQDVDGSTALAFARMRYDDPIGDIGRAQRQHQVIDKSAQKILGLVKSGDVFNLYNVPKLIPIAKTMLGFVKFDQTTSLWGIKDMVERFKSASSAATPDNAIIPIENPLGFDDEVGSIVEVDGDEVRKYLKGIASE